MSPCNTFSTPAPSPSWRDECAWLRSLVALAGGPDNAPDEERLRRIDDRLDQPEPSRPGELPDLALAQATIDAMKRGEAIDGDGIRALVATAELGIEGVRSFEIRWEADMRAIKRYREFSPNQSEIIWPGHADLVVWLLTQLEYQPPIPPLAEVEALLARLSAAVLASGGNALAVDSRKMISRMAELLRWSMRLNFVSEQGRAQLGRQLAKAIAFVQRCAAGNPASIGPTRNEAVDLLEAMGVEPDPPGTIREPDPTAGPTGADALAYGLSGATAIMDGPEGPEFPSEEPI